MSKSASKKFQSPKGTRDFYPADMAVRRYIEKVWRETSINHGFEEVDGPTFEDVELYKHKSGPGIVSEVFGVYSGKDEEELSRIRSGGDAPFALRPEFTPTLARMVAAKAAELPRPIKWFAIPSMFRAERPQRGRLREHFQWNVDFVGGEDELAKAEAEVIACAVAALAAFGLPSQDVTVKLSHRILVASLLRSCGVAEDHVEASMTLLDKRDRTDAASFHQQANALSLDMTQFDERAQRMGEHINSVIASRESGGTPQTPAEETPAATEVVRLIDALSDAGALHWCEFDVSIVRGLAYYTGTVFEIIAEGERAIAGGGRYDKLIESFGGPSLPACGFGMGDVVLANLLRDKGLLDVECASYKEYLDAQRPDAFVIAASDDAGETLPSLVATLRKAGYHIRHSYRSTRNVGKLLGEAGKAHARFAIILGKGLEDGRVVLKDMESGEQREVGIGEVGSEIRM